MKDALAIGVALFTSACSLFGLDVLQQPPCTDDAQCEILNQRYPERTDTCTRYQCIGVCMLAAIDEDGDGESSIACGGIDCDDSEDARVGEGAPEACDGIDNDCDLVIDEARGMESVARADVVTDFTLSAGASLHVAPDGALSWVDGAQSANVARLSDPFPVEPGVVEYARRTLSYSADDHVTAGVSAAGCLGAELPIPAPSGGGPMVGSSCAVHADCDDGILCNGYERCEPLDPGADADGCLAGAEADACGVNTCDEANVRCVRALGCGFRDFMVGATDRTIGVALNSVGCDEQQLRVGAVEDGELVLSGLPEGPSLELGLPTLCSEHVDAPAIAALTLDPSCGDAPDPQALIAWHASSEAPSSCARESAAEVRAIGVWLADELDTGPWWPHPSDDGAPVVLGRTLGVAPPAIVAWRDRGWFVAYADESGAVVARFVERLGCHPTASGVRVATEALAIHDAAVLFGAELADHLAIALREEDGAVELGLAWQRGCGTDARVAFGLVRYDDARDLFEPVSSVLASDPDRAGASPAITYSERAFVEAGGPHAPTDRSIGGWLVAWIDDGAQSRMLGRRFSALDGASIEEPFTLSAPSSNARHTAALPFFARASDGSLLAGYHDVFDGSLRAGTACAAIE